MKNNFLAIVNRFHFLDAYKLIIYDKQAKQFRTVFFISRRKQRNFPWFC